MDRREEEKRLGKRRARVGGGRHRAERTGRLLGDWRVAGAPWLRGLPGPAQAEALRRPTSRRRPAAAGSRSSRPLRSQSPSVS